MKRNKTGTIIIVILLIVLVIAALIVVWCIGSNNKKTNSGENYSQIVVGTGSGFGGDITATVNYAYGKIIDLSFIADGETPEVGGQALDTIRLEVLNNGTTNGVDVVSGATYTSNGAFEAINDALTKLKGR